MPARNLVGGWYDAGDYNKYTNYIWEPMLNMLLAYEEKPDAWSYDYKIPESSSSLVASSDQKARPDILDELKYELDWMNRMRNGDGGQLSVVGTLNYAGGFSSPPSKDTAPRYYGPVTTQATAAAAGIYALAAIEFYKSAVLNPSIAVTETAYADMLKAWATRAWTWVIANPNRRFYNSIAPLAASGTTHLAAGDQEGQPAELPNNWTSDARVKDKKLVAAVYLRINRYCRI